MSAACTSEPISYLRLERYLLRELSAGESARVDAHLQGCAACRGCLQELRANEVELRPLPAALSARLLRPTAERKEPGRSRRRLAALGSGLALAAVVLLGLRALLERPPGDAGRRGGDAVKGGEVALELVRERDGDVARDPRGFADGDRFAAQVSCAPPARAYFELVVYQSGQAYFPLAAGRVTCGNGVALPGAFALTGAAPATVCVVLADAPPPRAQLGAAGASPARLPARHACTTVAPQPR